MARATGFTGWYRRPGYPGRAKWRAVVQAETEAEAWRLVELYREPGEIVSERLVLRAGERPNHHRHGIERGIDVSPMPGEQRRRGKP